jgi:hypothetical protein
MKSVLFLLGLALTASTTCADDTFTPLWDGKTLNAAEESI